MDPADAADGRRRTQAWMGAPDTPPGAPQRSLRWMPNTASSAPPAAATRSPGAVVGGRYRLVRSLGQGVSTAAWEATQIDSGRALALKFVGGEDAGATFEAARKIAGVRHPHVAELYDCGRTELGEVFVVMELLVGQTVAQLLARRGVIPWARSVAIIQQTAAALGAAHQQGVVHGDLRPQHVFLLDTGEAGDFSKVAGFTLARTAGAAPSFMSPEQCRGEALDPRSDVYAIGCLLFAMVTGDPPFVGDAQQVIWQQLNEAPKRLRDRAPRQFIPDELEAIVARCLAKLPAQRFADTRELAAELASLAQFSAAASVVGAQIQDASASGARPMGFAGRPAPRSPRELTNSYKPVNQPIIDDEPEPAPRSSQVPAQPGMSPPAIVAATLAGVVAVVGFGVGMYLLVLRLIAEPPAAATVPDDAAKVDARPVSAEQAVAPTRTSAAAPTPAPIDPSHSIQAPVVEPSAPEPSTPPAAKPSKKSASKPVEPEPEPSEPEPSEPEPSKPSVDPESKAKDKIGHDELLDPWG